MTKSDEREASNDLLAVVRVRGRVDVRPEVRHTLALLRLHRSNHCVLVRNSDTIKGMLHVGKDRITWGEINKETLIELLKKRACFVGGKLGLSSEDLNDTEFNNVDNLVGSLLDAKYNLKKLNNLKPVFRLHPPRKGYSGIKKPFTKGGALGYRGNAINKLLLQMV